MSFITETQGTINIAVADDHLENWLESLLIDRKADGVAETYVIIMSKLVSQICSLR